MKMNISTKILCSVLAVTFIVMSGMGLVNFLHDKRELSLDLRQETDVAAKRLSHALVNSVWNLDDEEIGRIIQYEVHNDRVRAVVLRAADGRLLTARTKSGRSRNGVQTRIGEPELAALRGGPFEANAEVLKGSQPLAKVTVYADEAPLQADLRHRLYASAFALLLLCVGLSAALYLVLRRSIVLPLRRLEESVHQISISNLSVPIPVSGSDEIGRLADRFRQMTVDLRLSLHRQRQKEEQLLQAQKMEAVGMLVGGISHDFNNILCAIAGSAELMSLRLQAEELTAREPIEKHLATIVSAGDRAADLIRQLLTLSMKQEVLLSATDLRDTVNHVVKLLQSSLDKSIKVQVELPAERAMVNADPVQMEQLLLNLCINASHAMTLMRPEGAAWGGNLSITLAVAGSDAAGEASEANGEPCWILTVTDTGVGMEDSVKEHIFNPFFSTKPKGVGSGLGLSMAYSIIMQHEGDITVHSEPGKGSSFEILLPALRRQQQRPASAGSAADRPLPAGWGVILVVDDDAAVRDNARQILTQCGYTVALADNGIEGIRLAQLHGPEVRLVLLDMIMPVLSGIDALPELRAAAPQAKVLLTSGYKQDPRVQSLLTKGAVDDFIHKPYPLNQLAWSVHALLPLEEQEHAGCAC